MLSISLGTLELNQYIRRFPTPDKLKSTDKLKPKIFVLVFLNQKRVQKPKFLYIPSSPNFNVFTKKKHSSPRNIANDGKNIIARGILLIVELLNAQTIDQTVFFCPEGSKVTKPLLSHFCALCAQLRRANSAQMRGKCYDERKR
jgi:hypothetical protein